MGLRTLFQRGFFFVGPRGDVILVAELSAFFPTANTRSPLQSKNLSCRSILRSILSPATCLDSRSTFVERVTQDVCRNSYAVPCVSTFLGSAAIVASMPELEVVLLDSLTLLHALALPVLAARGGRMSRFGAGFSSSIDLPSLKTNGGTIMRLLKADLDTSRTRFVGFLV